MNSVIQALAGTDVFASYFISKRYVNHLESSIISKIQKKKYMKKYGKSCKDNEDNEGDEDNEDSEETDIDMDYLRGKKKKTITYWLHKVIDRMWSTNCVITLKTFRQIAQDRIVAVRGFNQEDASEFLVFLLDELEQDLRNRCAITYKEIHTAGSLAASQKYTEMEADINAEDNSDIKKIKDKELLLLKNKEYYYYMIHEYMKTWNEYLNKGGGNYSIITDIFTFSVISEIECLSCRTKSIKIEIENMMKVHVPKSEKPVELDDLICTDNDSIETLDGGDQYNCSICESKQNASKHLHVWNMPERLIIQLKLFEFNIVMGQYQYDKISTKVNFPVNLDLNKYKSIHNPVDLNYQYELYAVIHHSGNPRGGHYISYVKNALNGQWFLFNDQRVMPVTEKFVLDVKPYILFYKRSSTFDPELDSSNEEHSDSSEPDESTPSDTYDTDDTDDTDDTAGAANNKDNTCDKNDKDNTPIPVANLVTNPVVDLQPVVMTNSVNVDRVNLKDPLVTLDYVGMPDICDSTYVDTLIQIEETD
jgi:ubiquitin C-terminal hydrolase